MIRTRPRPATTNQMLAVPSLGPVPVSGGSGVAVLPGVWVGLTVVWTGVAVVVCVGDGVTVVTGVGVVVVVVWVGVEVGVVGVAVGVTVSRMIQPSAHGGGVGVAQVTATVSDAESGTAGPSVEGSARSMVAVFVND